jgi:DNA mismatch repair protein MutS2
MAFEDAARKLEFGKVVERILRYASSDPGRAAIDALPISTSRQQITEELSLVSEVKGLLERETELPLGGIADIRSQVRRAAIEGTILTPRELLQIASTLRAARVVRAYLARHSDECPLVWGMVHPLHVQKVLEFNIDGAIDESETVRENASKELKAIRRAIVDRYDLLRKRLDRILKSVSEQGFSQDDIITTRDGRMVIPVKVEHKNRVPGFVHSTSASGATVFVEPTETLDLNNEITDLQFRERRETERILAELTHQVGELRDDILADLEILAHVDSLHARAKYSIEVLGIEPVVSREGPLTLIGARHPALISSHGFEGTVPLDLELGDTYDTLVISGPNAGGKSVTLKCVGLLSLMAQAGIHVPASRGSTLRIFDRMFVDIGDEQSIENDLSTFSSHLANLKQILSDADGNSLVLVDEIGSGTDPAEGSSIAAAVLEALTRSGSLTIATTHQGSLKVFAHQTARVENGAMEFDPGTLRPTYRFRAGIPGSSYALEMARRLEIGDQVLERAREMLGEAQSRLEVLLVELEEKSLRYRRDLEDLTARKSRLDQMIGEHEARAAVQQKELKEHRRDALAEATRIIADANALIEESVRKIRESSADRETVREVRQNVQRFREIVEQAPEPALVRSDPGVITVGSMVRLAEATEPGKVDAMAETKGMAYVVFGNVRMKVRLSDLVPLRNIETKKPGFALPAETISRAETRDLDIRGMTGDEAIPLVDKFIDSAVLSGLHRVDIIHGKGTGALRKRITAFLANHPRVKSYRLGEWNEGGAGATVVELAE